MTRFLLQSIETAVAASKIYLEKVKNKNGYIPNLLGILSNAPTALEAYLTVSEINSRTSFSFAERETIQITAAAKHACGFCVAGHTAIAYKQGHLSEDLVNALRNESSLPDPKLDALAIFTRTIIDQHGEVTQKQLAAFFEAGYCQQQAIETVLGISLATLCNFTNIMAETELNPELSEYSWPRPSNSKE
jgi:AhpD family alkylhydroperoxidase